MARNPFFTQTLDEMEALHSKKNHDYAEDSNPFSNFEYAAAHAGITVEQVFDVMLGIKQARLRQLTAKDARNESKRDTLLDRAVYATIALAYDDWVADGKPLVGEQVDQPTLFDEHPEVPTPAEFSRTLANIDTLLEGATEFGRATLNPKRRVRDEDDFPPPNPVIDAADFRTEGD